MTQRESQLLERLREATLALRRTLNERDALILEKLEPVAIVGIGCRFPGGAENPSAFWDLLDAGRDAVQPLDARWALVGAHPNEAAPRWAGLVTGAVDSFDAAFFGISPREALSLDPQQRLLLEVAWEAFEDAGILPDALAGSRTGVFVGASTTDYASLVQRQPPEELDAYSTTGNALSIAAGRLSYTWGIQGPCLTIDTACSSSLVAVHLACHSLRTRESDLALAGGVNLLLSPDSMDALGRTQALSPEGRCKTFDALANGFTRGEGCGVVVLKRLSDAQRDGDRIWALIRGSAVNQDGRSTGLTAPNVLAQEALLREALRSARVEASDIGFVETHGTGTSLGDPIEVEALRAVVGAARPDGGKCVLGAVKTNLGHLEAAAGVAGLIKAVLALHHERIPQNLHLRTLNPRLRLEGTALVPATGQVTWPRGARPRFAGVSSFGFSGTNAHVVLEEAPAAAARPAAPVRSAELFMLSAKSAAALAAAAGRLRDHLFAHPSLGLGDVAFSLATTRSHLPHRLSVVATSREALRGALDAAAQGQTPPGAVCGMGDSSGGKLAFLFTGQGAQVPGMGRGLYEAWPAFREAFERCVALFDRELERPLREVMWAEAGSAEASLLDQTGYTQPALFALEYALFALWRSWGVEAELLAGHSIGEVVAACVAGVFSLEDAVRLVSARGRLMQALPPGGAMVSLEASEFEVAAVITAQAGRVSIAVVNGPTQVVIAGDAEPVQAIAASFAARGVRTKALQVSHAFHSSRMDPMLEAFQRVASSVVYHAPERPVVSNVTGAIAGPEMATAAYWVRHVREAVRFADGVKALHGAEAATFLEIGPKPTLLGLVPACLSGAEPALVASLRGGREEATSVLEALGSLWTAGGVVDWAGLFPAGGARVALPTYPWQRERYWIDAPAAEAQGARGRAHAGGHPLLGEAQTVSTQPGMRHWETTLDQKRLPWLVDHRVQGVVVFPGAGYLEMALAAGAEVFDKGPVVVTDVAFVEAMAFPGDAALEVQMVTTEEPPGRVRFQIASKLAGGSHAAWTVHVRGVMRRADRAEAPARLDVAGVRARLGAGVPAGATYTALGEMGLEYGPVFQGLTELWQGEGEALGRVRLPEAAGAATAYQIHPALLDACFHVMGGSFREDEKTSWLPVAVGSLRLFQRQVGELWCHARIVPQALPASTQAAPQRRSADFSLVDSTGALVAEVSGLVVQKLASGPRRNEQDDWFLELAWESAKAPAPTAANGRGGAGRFLLLGEGDGLGAALRAALEAAGHMVVHAFAEVPGKVPVGCWPVNDTSAVGVRALLGDAFREQAPTAVVHLRSLEGNAAVDGSTLEAALARGCDSVLCTVQALAGTGYRDAPRLWLVTRGAQAVGAGPSCVEQAPLLGLGRVISVEHPELRCARVDLDPARPARELESLLAELLGDEAEQEIAHRGGERRVARIARRLPEAGRREKLEPAGGRPFRLEIDKPGVLDDLVLRATERRPPGPGEVEIAVEAASLNFIDVMKAMGIYPGLGDGPVALGGECAGRIVAVGEGVSEFAPGQDVLAVASFSFATHVTVDARTVALRPGALTAAQAAAVPAVLMTAWYALVQLARLQRGERVLIHSATGGTGLAAVQIARHLGAEIFATAGTPEKRAWLRAQGIAHVMDSRSLGFAEEVLAATGGEGVDVVLNSLSGAAIEASLSTLAPDGRFLELGKTDIYADRALGLSHFKKSLSYSAVDLAGLSGRRPERFAALLREVVTLLAEGTLKPLPVETFPISRATDAFRKMAQAQHAGKLVLTVDDPDVAIQLPAQARAAIRGNGSYLVTGGLGGLGLSVAGWLADQGAGHLVLLGRSGAASAEQQAAVAALEAKGARVTVAKADVAIRAQMESVLAEIAASGMPLSGVVHTAGLLDDGLLMQQTSTRFRDVMAPKILGALHLDALTRGSPVDFFVMYSSAAGLLGSPGQGNYAAANSFLDALAHRRKAQALPALSIDWGAFSEVGLAAAQDNRGARLVSRGAGSITPRQGLEALERILGSDLAQVGVVPLDARQWAEADPAAAGSSMFSRLLAREPDGAESNISGSTFAARLMCATPETRSSVVQEFVRAQVARVLRLPESKLDNNIPLIRIGLDSLMGLELKHWLKREATVDVPVARLLSGVTIQELAALLADGLPVVSGGAADVKGTGTWVDTEL